MHARVCMNEQPCAPMLSFAQLRFPVSEEDAKKRARQWGVDFGAATAETPPSYLWHPSLAPRCNGGCSSRSAPEIFSNSTKKIPRDPTTRKRKNFLFTARDAPTSFSQSSLKTSPTPTPAQSTPFSLSLPFLFNKVDDWASSRSQKKDGNWKERGEPKGSPGQDRRWHGQRQGQGRKFLPVGF